MIDQVFRDEWGRVLASLIGYFGDFDLAEDAAAEAFAIAAQRWPSDGLPDNPVGWLVTTARHRAIDRLRRDRVLAVVYLIFNEGYGDRDRPGLAAEAIRLERVLAVLLPAQPEVLGLLALMLLHHSRRGARFDGQDLVLLPDQDRSRWDWPQIAEGRALLDRATEIAARIPAVRLGGSVEIRPVVTDLD